MSKTKIELQELRLVTEQCFKFLYSLGFGRKNKAMFPVRESYEIDRSIIISYSIKVMDYPTIWQEFIVSLFPYQYMLADISSFICSRMFWKEYLNISSYLTPATFIYSISNSPLTRTNGYLVSAGLTMLRPIINEFTTRAKFPVPETAFFALSQLLFTMRMIILTMIFFRIHNLIVTQNTTICKGVM